MASYLDLCIFIQTCRISCVYVSFGELRQLSSSVFALKLSLVSSGRTVSASGTSGPFRAFPKSLSVDFGGLTHPHQQPLPHSLSQQQAGSVGQTTPTPPVAGSNPQDRYAAVSHLDSCFSDPPTVTAPPGGPPQYNAIFGSRPSSSSTPASSPGVDTVSSSQTFANFPNPFSSSSASSQQPVALSPSNPFSNASGGDSSAFVTSPTSVFPPSASFPAPNTQNAFHHESASNQEANGFASFPAPDSQPKVPRPMSVNPFTGNVYPSRGTSRNPFI
ncbi:arf-GAP domain and FG repeat-containing protein 1-like [Cebidichthys violaceus]|uniref:arf-GAP domain and FG repeat-containing protein 1-like n=1 Tax=Cebidichthys violaceus TaxID=271503 RepID=UPI0035CB760F